MVFNGKLTGERIKERRKAKGLTQEELATKLATSRQYISYYEKATRSVPSECVLLLAQELDTTTDYLLGLSGDPTNNPDMKRITDFTGLSETSVMALNLEKCISDSADINGVAAINAFIETALVYVIHEVEEYKNALKSSATILSAIADDPETVHASMFKAPGAKNSKRSVQNLLYSESQISQSEADKVDIHLFRASERFRFFIDKYTETESEEYYSAQGKLIKLFGEVRNKALEYTDGDYKKEMTSDEWRRIINGKN